MSFDTLPTWGIFLVTLALIALGLEAGFRIGRGRQRRGGAKAEWAGAVVGATMGLVAFMLAFTFNGAAGRHEARKSLVIEEVNAIDQTWLRAGLLAGAYRADVRAHLREYVDVRVKAASAEMDIAPALRRSEELQDRIWARALEAAEKDPGAITTGLFIQSLNHMIDVHLRRLTVAVRNRVPPTIWAALFLLTTLAMIMMGTQIGFSGARCVALELALALAFSVALFLIADLDRPQEGLVNVSQQAMTELQTKLRAR
jgi:hypothetical protein